MKKIPTFMELLYEWRDHGVTREFEKQAEVNTVGQVVIQATWLCAQSLSHVWLLATPWPVARQAPLSMGFSRQEWEWVAPSFSRGPFWPRIKPAFLALAGGFFTTESPGKPIIEINRWGKVYDPKQPCEVTHIQTRKKLCSSEQVSEKKAPSASTLVLRRC